MLQALYQFIFVPLELLFETVYGIAYHFLDGNVGMAIIPLSLTINLLLLPLYQRADTIQAETRIKEKQMEPNVAHIKKHFSGDERFMILQAYYRECHYQPIYALRSSLPLLLEIPFFVAAYHFLSNLSLLHGASFGILSDLSKPDGLLRIGDLSINVLPILMTLINIISSLVYTKGFSRRDKLQLYVMALIFLALLYTSPSGLVFYWMLNNLFSLIKNIIFRSGKKKTILNAILGCLSAMLLYYAILRKLLFQQDVSILVLVAVIMLLPVILSLKKNRPIEEEKTSIGSEYGKIFLSGCLFLTLLTGVLIPSEVVRSSPAEFIISTEYHTPIQHVFQAFLLAAGVFLLWFGVFYALSEQRGKRIAACGIWVACSVAIVNYFFFGTGLGTLSAQLKYDVTPDFTPAYRLINLLIIATVAGLCLLVWVKRNQLVKTVLSVLILAVIGISAFNIVNIEQALPGIRATLEQNNDNSFFRLSKTGKNVVVLMMDKAINSFIPYIMHEKPELLAQFDGFTWYPNTISFGAYTNVGSPPLYGGYEYTPEEMNRRSDETLESKQNEALKVMPILFDEAGYEVTVCDPPYAGYEWIPDLSIYDDHPNIRAFNTSVDQCVDELDRTNNNTYKKQAWKRSFFCYSIMKISPVFLQPTLYQDGLYYNPNDASSLSQVQVQTSPSTAEGVRDDFMNAYGVLCTMPKLTVVTEEDVNTFLVLANCATHDPILLQEPDYTPAMKVDNTAYDSTHQDRFTVDGQTINVTTEWQMIHYHVNMASMLKLGEWFEYLQSQGVYDNTRIIIVADHGKYLGSFEDRKIGDRDSDDTMWYNPLLLVKDFGSTGFHTDKSFMTNADTPTLALDRLIEHPVNPFSGKAITDWEKHADELRILYTHDFDVRNQKGATTFQVGRWYVLRNQNIFDMNNWSCVEERTVTLETDQK